MDAARVFGDGEPIELVNGKTVTVRYGMRSLMQLERTFGGIANVQTAISSDGTGPLIEPSLQLIAAGLVHENLDGAPLTVDVLAEQLEASKLQDYIVAAGRALQTAFPTGAGATPAATPEELSRSTTGSISESSSSDAASQSGSA